MNIAYLRMRRILTIAALALVTPVTFARPVLVAPIRLEVPPLVGEPGQYRSTYGAVAIDGDTLLVGAERSVSAGERRKGVHVFQRAADGSWSHQGPLFEGTFEEVYLSGNIAAVNVPDGIQVYERGAQGWAAGATISTSGKAVRVSENSIYVIRFGSGSPSCAPPYQQFRKVNGTWSAVATIGPQICAHSSSLDVNGGRAILSRTEEFNTGVRFPVGIYQDTGASSWPLVAALPQSENLWGGTLNGNTAAVGTHLFRNNGSGSWVSQGVLFQPEQEVQQASGSTLLRGNYLFAQGDETDYEPPNLGPEWYYIWEYQIVRVYRQLPSGSFGYYAKLAVDFDVRGWSPSEDGRRVVATSSDDNYGDGPPTRLYVFEMPEGVTFPGTQQDTFESGNLARWTPTAGQFTVAVTDVSRVLRQSSLTGDAGAIFTAVDWGDQSIEADIRPLEFSGNDRWFGLVTRRTDANNYYYVTYRATGVVSLRRMRNGVVTELGRSYVAGIVPGHSHRVRLESAGDQHAVFFDGLPRVRAKDASLTHGHPGVAGYRTRFDVDNVIVSGGSRLTTRFDIAEGDEYWESPRNATGTWEPVWLSEPDSAGMRQSDTSGDARWFSQVPIGNQVVALRVRPSEYGATTGTQDPWVGVAAQVKDESNYYYVTLRRSGQFSLRRMINGTIQVLGTVPQPVSTGTWYDLRLEIIGTNIRAYVDGDLKISATDATISGGGRNAILTYKTAADFWWYVAYQP
jgi:hypothetical protein